MGLRMSRLLLVIWGTCCLLGAHSRQFLTRNAKPIWQNVPREDGNYHINTHLVTDCITTWFEDHGNESADCGTIDNPCILWLDGWYRHIANDTLVIMRYWVPERSAHRGCGPHCWYHDSRIYFRAYRNVHGRDFDQVTISYQASHQLCAAPVDTWVYSASMGADPEPGYIENIPLEHVEGGHFQGICQGYEPWQDLDIPPTHCNTIVNWASFTYINLFPAESMTVWCDHEPMHGCGTYDYPGAVKPLPGSCMEMGRKYAITYHQMESEVPNYLRMWENDEPYLCTDYFCEDLRTGPIYVQVEEWGTTHYMEIAQGAYDTMCPEACGRHTFNDVSPLRATFNGNCQPVGGCSTALIDENRKELCELKSFHQEDVSVPLIGKVWVHNVPQFPQKVSPVSYVERLEAGIEFCGSAEDPCPVTRAPGFEEGDELVLIFHQPGSKIGHPMCAGLCAEMESSIYGRVVATEENIDEEDYRIRPKADGRTWRALCLAAGGEPCGSDDTYGIFTGVCQPPGKCGTPARDFEGYGLLGMEGKVTATRGKGLGFVCKDSNDEESCGSTVNAPCMASGPAGTYELDVTYAVQLQHPARLDGTSCKLGDCNSFNSQFVFVKIIDNSSTELKVSSAAFALVCPGACGNADGTFSGFCQAQPEDCTAPVTVCEGGRRTTLARFVAVPLPEKSNLYKPRRGPPDFLRWPWTYSNPMEGAEGVADYGFQKNFTYLPDFATVFSDWDMIMMLDKSDWQLPEHDGRRLSECKEQAIDVMILQDEFVEPKAAQDAIYGVVVLAGKIVKTLSNARVSVAMFNDKPRCYNEIIPLAHHGFLENNVLDLLHVRQGTKTYADVVGALYVAATTANWNHNGRKTLIVSTDSLPRMEGDSGLPPQDTEEYDCVRKDYMPAERVGTVLREMDIVVAFTVPTSLVESYRKLVKELEIEAKVVDIGRSLRRIDDKALKGIGAFCEDL